MKTGRMLCLIVAALMGIASLAPGGADAGAPEVRGSDYVLLIDCTGTMRSGGKGEATVAAIERFVESMNPGDRISVYGYGEEPFPAMPAYPATVGSETSRESIGERIVLPFTADRTDITRGLDFVWKERDNVFSSAVKSSGRGRGGSAYVVLLTDGKLIPMYDDYSEYDDVYRESRARFRELGGLFAATGIPVYTVGLGAPDRVDGDMLSELSEATGGSYFQVDTGRDLARTFDEIIGEIITAPGEPEIIASLDANDGEAAATPPSAAPSNGGRRLLDGVVESASAAETGAAADGAWLTSAFDDVGQHVYRSVLGILGVVMGFVAIGIHRRQSWTGVFTKPLLQKETRVKGYLRRVLPEGVIAAHRNIPIENPGLPEIQIGVGTGYAAELRETVLEFVGTSDGSPPCLRVVKGDARVAGEPVEETRPLADGDIIECEGKAYKYLRGQRQ